MITVSDLHRLRCDLALGYPIPEDDIYDMLIVLEEVANALTMVGSESIGSMADDVEELVELAGDAE